MTSQPPSSQPPIVKQSPATSGANRSQRGPNPLLHNRGLILGLLFGVTAALGLPLLWYSPVFNRREKWFWSAVNIVYTLILIAIAVVAVWFAMTALSNSNSAF